MSADLQKLTVAQLKALCREKGLTVYSKLAKSALVEKLAATGQRYIGAPSGVPDASTTTIAQPPGQNKKNTTKADVQSTISRPLVISAQEERPAIQNIIQHGSVASPVAPVPPLVIRRAGPLEDICIDSPAHTGAAVKNDTRKQRPTGNQIFKTSRKATENTQEDVTATCNRRLEGQQAQGPPRAGQAITSTQNSTQALISDTRLSPSAPEPGSGEPLSKKQKTTHVKNHGLPQVQQAPCHIPQPSGQARKNTQTTKAIPVKIQSTSKGKNAHIPRGIANTGKRYIPLVIKPKGEKDSAAVLQTSSTVQLITTTNLHRASSPILTSLPTSLSTGLFTFPSPPEDESALAFNVITFPPTLSQRKFAVKLAVILRDVEIKDMLSLTLTSRLFRYSVYLSAVGHLKRWYPGERLNEILRIKGVSVDRMNLWGYRRSREREVLKRMEVIRGGKNGETLLGKMVNGDVGVIEDWIWRRDEVKELVVALRFLLTRCYFCVSLNRGLGEVRRERVVDLKEVVRDEIWCVTTVRRDESRKSTKRYVLDATSEVIGSPVGLDGTLPTRGDWATYIQGHLSETGADESQNIMDHVRWGNHEEYVRGISKVWLRRTQQEGDVGQLKREIAKRYILACTMENSLSGRYMNSAEMEQELNGLPGKVAVCPQTRGRRVNLFVPAHHHVESVHFTSGSKGMLHPALAIIQTPSREYFILKENGMQVGCEEEGVGEVWMAMLGCTASGEAKV